MKPAYALGALLAAGTASSFFAEAHPIGSRFQEPSQSDIINGQDPSETCTSQYDAGLDPFKYYAANATQDPIRSPSQFQIHLDDTTAAAPRSAGTTPDFGGQWSDGTGFADSSARTPSDCSGVESTASSVGPVSQSSWGSLAKSLRESIPDIVWFKGSRSENSAS